MRTILVALVTLSGLAAAQDRPAVPYSRPPVSAEPRDGTAIAPLVAPGLPAPEPRPVPPGDDSVPLPGPAIWSPGPGGDVLLAPASGDPHFLGFVSGDHHPDPGQAVDPRLYAASRAEYADGRPTPETYAFVMFSARMTPGRLALLEAEGCRLLGFHPHYTQKVALPAAAIDPVAALPFVRWVGVQQPWQKVQPALTERLATALPNQPLEVWISVHESDVGPTSVRRGGQAPVWTDPSGNTAAGTAPLMEHVWHTDGWMEAALTGAGLEVLDFHGRTHAFRARMMPQGLDLVTALDFVQFVELDLPAQLDHEDSMPMVNADDARNDYDGGVNTRAVVGLADSGVQDAHQDINIFGIGWNISEVPGGHPFDDDCGHGTHVAGTILGQGVVDSDLTGAAPGLGTWTPGGLVYNVRIFADCDPEPVDDAIVIGLLNTAAGSPRPHVHNHSWGSGAGSAWSGTEAEARLWDDHVYQDAQLPVRSAGNAGPAYLAVGLQASAKNVLTVGSVDDWDALGNGLTGQLSDLSSRGPTADGRWKPNVVAPGTIITSADAFDPTGYTSKVGTSMAAPHVTGVAACLIDKDASFVYLPERISAHLMATAHRRGGLILSSPLHTHLSEYGAGRVDASQALWSQNGSSWTSWAFGLPATWGNQADFTVPAGATRLTVVMHYVEPSASAGASKALVNDWDLWLDAPPIVSTTTNVGEYSSHQSPNDNTEIRSIVDPTPGVWRWKVHPDSTTTNAYFGLTVHVETGNRIPPITPTMTTTKTIAQPGELVQVDYYVPPSGVPLSSLFVDTDVDGPVNYQSIFAVLADGTWADMTSNPYGGLSLVLGNVGPAWRMGRWNVSWPYDGVYDFDASAFADNASNSGATSTVTVTVDGTPPGAVTGLQSTSHSVFGFSCDPDVTMTWDPTPDPLSGLAGYAWQWTEVPSAAPPAAVMTTATTVTAAVPSTGGPAWYFRIHAIDQAGNVGQTVGAGPYFIDPDPVEVYCAPKPNSQNCEPAIEGGGLPSVGGEFEVKAQYVLNNKSGLLFWGLTPTSVAFKGGFKCVANPITRTPIQNSGGNPPPDDCSGVYSFTFDPPYLSSKGLTAGTTVYAQYWTRDPNASFNTGLTDALQFTLCP